MMTVEALRSSSSSSSSGDDLSYPFPVSTRSSRMQEPSEAERSEAADIVNFVDCFCDCVFFKRWECTFNASKLNQVNRQFQRFASQKPFDAPTALLAGAAAVIVTSFLPNRLVRVVTQVGLALVGGLAYKMWTAEKVVSGEEKELINIFRKAAQAFRQEWQRTSERICTEINQGLRESTQYTLSSWDRINSAEENSCRQHEVDQEPKFAALERASEGKLWRGNLKGLMEDQRVEIFEHFPDLDSTLQKELRYVFQEGRRAYRGRSDFAERGPYVSCTIKASVVDHEQRITRVSPWSAAPLLPIFTSGMEQRPFKPTYVPINVSGTESSEEGSDSLWG